MPSVAPTPVVPPATARSDAGAEALVRAALAVLAKLAPTPGATVAATVVGPLPNGLTQLIAGNRTLALQLAPPPAAGATLTLGLQSTPDGPKIVVRPTLPPAQSQSPVQPLVQVPATQLPAPPPSAAAVTAFAAGPKSLPGVTPPPTPSPLVAVAPTAAARPRPVSVSTNVAAPAVTVPTPAPLLAPATAMGAARTLPQPLESDALPAPDAAPDPALDTELPGRMRSATGAYVGTRPRSSSLPARQGIPTGPATATPASSELQIVDPQQAVARQQSAAPLIARLAAVIARPDLPPQLRDAAMKVLASRLSLDAGAPGGEALRAAIEGSGTFATPRGNDSRNALLVLRAALLHFAGAPATLAHATGRAAPAPPLAGDPPQRGEPMATAALDGDRQDVIRQLLGHTEGVLSRLKLLQLASQPADQRSQTPAAAAEYRVEIPMLLRGEIGMVQFVIEREARQKARPNERGWRMRFALSFSATGEIGADVGLYGRTVNVALWADDPATSAALATAAADLSPALARHGISLGAVRIRHGRPASPERASGTLLDSTG
jgi:hypothetical protein